MDLKAVTSAATAGPDVEISAQVLQGGGGVNGGPANLFPQIGLNISAPPNTVWRVESADTLTGPWQLVEVVSNTVGGVLSVIDTGQNGRLAPWATGVRFYRLVPE